MISNTDSTLLIYSTEHMRVKACTGRGPGNGFSQNAAASTRLDIQSRQPHISNRSTMEDNLWEETKLRAKPSCPRDFRDTDPQGLGAQRGAYVRLRHRTLPRRPPKTRCRSWKAHSMPPSSAWLSKAGSKLSGGSLRTTAVPAITT